MFSYTEQGNEVNSYRVQDEVTKGLYEITYKTIPSVYNYMFIDIIPTFYHYNMSVSCHYEGTYNSP